jgi:hypothetical protein
MYVLKRRLRPAAASLFEPEAVAGTRRGASASPDIAPCGPATCTGAAPTFMLLDIGQGAQRLARSLEGCGWQSVEHQGADPATPGQGVDLVILDPVGGRGIAFAAALRFLGTAVIVVSEDASLLEAASEAGLPCLAKPVDADALLALARALKPPSAAR